MADERGTRAELQAANFAKRSSLGVFLRFTFLQMRFEIITVRVRFVAIGAAMRTNFGRRLFDAA